MIVIPDVHGRTFWRDAVEGRENEEIIFLGDYLDPYGWENIKGADAIDNFQDILWFKEDHPDNVILLVGNHDLVYMDEHAAMGGRTMWRFFDEIAEMYKEHANYFQMAYEKVFGDKRILFTHAGVRLGWLDSHKELNLPNGEGLAQALNTAFQQKERQDFIKALGDVSRFRGGYQNFGSSVWADVDEHLYDEYEGDLLNAYQVFGHSQQEKDPIITPNFACLDCRQAFEIDDEGNIKPLEKLTENTNKIVDDAVNKVLNK